jgi:hypothetical protein
MLHWCQDHVEELDDDDALALVGPLLADCTPGTDGTPKLKINTDDLQSHAVHTLAAFSYEHLDEVELDGLAWLCGPAELDNDLTWCGQWHVGG